MKILILLLNLALFSLVAWGLFLLSPFSAEAQNIPTGPRGCFIEDGQDDCSVKTIDCGNAIKDYKEQGLESFYYLVDLYGFTVGELCNYELIIEREAERLYTQTRKLKRKLRRIKRGRK